MDPQDVAHERRLREFENLGREIHYIEAMGMALEVKGIKVSSDAMRKAEEIVYSIPPNSVAALVAAEMNV